MRVHTKIVSELMDDGTWRVIEDVAYDYDGPVVQLKKGRETMGANAKTGQQNAATDQANAQSQYTTANQLEQQDIANSTPGSLSPAATAQLAADRDQIASTYNGLARTAFTTMGQRGFGNAPSGFGVAAQNGLNVGQEQADTGAYRNAQVNTQNQRNQAMSTAAGLSGQQGNLANSALSGSTNAAMDQNKAGSTLGDIAGAVAEAAPIIAAPFTGGASLAAMGIPGIAGGGAFSKIGKNSGSGVGTYGPSNPPSVCWVAAELYGGWHVPEVGKIRNWLLSTPSMKSFLSFYQNFGAEWAEMIKTDSTLRTKTRALFDTFLRMSNAS